MTITLDEIRTTTEHYLSRYPEEAESLKRLLWSLENETDLTSRKEFRGHVTCGVILLDDQWRVLHIRHKALNRWLLPGGHVEPKDLTLLEAALRELEEETSIGSSSVSLLPGSAGAPLDIDVHLIPHNQDKGEPEHWHFDFRYVFQTTGADVMLQAEEVTDHGWMSLNQARSESVRTKLEVFRPA